ncbi:hypothetical protein BDU57DRAFT_557400 [Ampelomyces quisqualis]|uniref:Survival protein SurE-like phosphatase/nucleotidase domain-containing protein n=1 Tax=Ampelomyces quisqualis TaxID=50730 RepID=A0A6A5QI12_AMPQU|nr:hypothetical protein BDU57DRAFT_557400 [Ampelomyces quisqualis]
MRSCLLLTAALPVAEGIRIIQTSHDGWAEANVRTFFDVLSNAGHQVVLSAPAQALPIAGPFDLAPREVGPKGCMYSSCPPGSPPTGADDMDPRLNYVNSYPVTAIKYGIHLTGPELWNGAEPEIALMGPEINTTTTMEVRRSGAYGTAVYAVKIAKIPAIIFAGASGEPTPWNGPVDLHSKIYADLAMNITASVLQSGKPYLPPDTILHVRFPQIESHRCNDARDVEFILTRFTPPFANDGDDVEWCGHRLLPWDTIVAIFDRFRDPDTRQGCYATISIMNTEMGPVNDVAIQQQIINKLRPVLSCLPE